MRAPLLLLPLLLLATPVAAADTAANDTYLLTLKSDGFSPNPLTIPAGQKIKLTVKNQTAVAAEFESSDLNREKVVEAGDQIIVILGPLDAGSYGYFNDFNHSVTGTIVAK